RADAPPTDRALAQSLFEEGRGLMKAGNYAQACVKLAESQRLDPAPGTQLNLAVCHEAEGKTATAWVEFNDALTQARRDGRAEREQLAQEHIAALTPKLSRLTVAVASAAKIDTLEIKLDGVVIREAAWGVPAPIDPGKHRVEASARGKKPWLQEVEVAKA